jgi:putative transposase
MKAFAVPPVRFMTYHRRNLPHWFPAGSAVFLTYRLYGSLPQNVISRLKVTQRLVEREIDGPAGSSDELSELKLIRHKQLFARIDSALDKATAGPRWLGEPEIASLVQTALLSRYADLYKLWAYVVMINHVHVLLRPKISRLGSNPVINAVSGITKNLKGYTAREANRILQRTGQPFWQQESFDHWPRNEAEFFRIAGYIENNPVSAGLVKRTQDWRWSSAAERERRGLTEIHSLT